MRNRLGGGGDVGQWLLTVSLTSHTLQLWSEAHTLGDDYYLKVNDLICNGRGSGEECGKLATSYLSALQGLEKDLSSRGNSDSVRGMKRTTKKHIALVREDLERLSSLEQTVK